MSFFLCYVIYEKSSFNVRETELWLWNVVLSRDFSFKKMVYPPNNNVRRKMNFRSLLNKVYIFHYFYSISFVLKPNRFYFDSEENPNYKSSDDEDCSYLSYPPEGGG